MGEVYRAEDGKLGREVAIKVLPAAVATDPERLARFEREAKVLAALNHPAIAAIHSFESAQLPGGRSSTELGREGTAALSAAGGETVHLLVMELAAGETLAERIERGPLPLDEALRIARQVAEALEAAHEKGIVHRDLKPANVKVDADGNVKVLDFGLAKALEGATAEGSSSPQLTHSPTLTGHATMGGLLLGTAAYMAPEQAAGRPADRRSDVWAFGAVCLEMLAGRQTFTGETVSHVLAAVLKDEPNWAALPASVPASVVELLRHCLRKDPKRRLQAIGDARVAIEDWLADPRSLAGAPAAPAAEATPAMRSTWPRLAAVGLGAAVLGAAAAWLARGLATPQPLPLRSVHLEMGFPAGHRAEALAPPAFSPDGRWIVFGARSVGSGREHLWLRSLERFESEALSGTEEAILPFWSPDGRSLGYFQDRALVRLDLETRIAQTICDCAPRGRGGAWGADGTILFAPHVNSGLLRIPATGGDPAPVTTVDPAIPDGSHRYPVLLPDGEHFLFTQWTNSIEDQRRYGGVFVGSFDGEPIRRLLPDASSVAFLAPGHLFLQRAGRLVAVPFDPEALTAGEDALAIDTGVIFARSAGLSFAAASTRGDLLYGLGSDDPDGEPVWLDRGGREIESLDVRTPARGWFPEIAPSPDGTRYAVTHRGALGRQILIGEPARGTLAVFTPDPNDSMYPTWSPDGERLAYVNLASGDEDVFIQSLRSTAPPERIVSGAEHDTQSLSWSRDGRLLFFTAKGKSEARAAELWVYDLERRGQSRLLAAAYDLDQAQLAPDGRWLAYTAFESGTPQVYLAPFPALDARWLVSSGPGSAAHWRDDGAELFYEAADDEGRRLMAVAVDGSGATPAIGPPEPLFALPPGVFYLAPARDHSRILALREVAAAESNTLRLVLNWRLLSH